jgi:predicted transcriptional regulator
MGRKPKSVDPYADINRRLDILIAIQLANKGLEKGEIAKILGVSTKTVQRMFAGKWSKISGGDDGEKEE